MAEDVDYLAVASMTDGMVGAELANIVEVAAINMMRDSRTEVIPPICSLSLADSYSSCILHVTSNLPCCIHYGMSHSISLTFSKV